MSVGDVWIAQLDQKRVPQARSSGCKSSVAVTAECLLHHEVRMPAESAECCWTRGSNCLPSIEAPARTATGEPDMPTLNVSHFGWVANGVHIVPAQCDHNIACQWSVMQLYKMSVKSSWFPHRVVSLHMMTFSKLFTSYVSLIKWYNLAEGWWCPASRKVTAGVALDWPYLSVGLVAQESTCSSCEECGTLYYLHAVCAEQSI